MWSIERKSIRILLGSRKTLFHRSVLERILVLGLGMDRCLSLRDCSVHGDVYRNVLYRLSRLLSASTCVSFSTFKSKQLGGCRTQSSEELILSSLHSEPSLFHSRQSGGLRHHRSLSGFNRRTGLSKIQSHHLSDAVLQPFVELHLLWFVLLRPRWRLPFSLL